MARTKKTARKSVGGPAPRPSSIGRPPFIRIWNIPELAEKILSYLPMKDLLLAQRVSSEWRNLIRSSPFLQALLFMRPRQIRGAEATQSSGSPVREYNPLLLSHMPFWFSKDETVWRRNVKGTAWAKTSARLIYLRPDASWRNMLLAQPPFTIFESVQNVHFYGGDSISVGRVELKDGVRMGLAYDQAVQPVQAGSQTLPNNFYTLMDGRITHDAELEDLTDPSERSSERLFGGLDKFTLFTGTTQSCCIGGQDRMQLRQFTSAGSDTVSIDRTDLYGQGYSWWTENGYRR